MERTEEFLEMDDGHKVYMVTWIPKSPIGHVHLLHGMAEHIGRFDDFARFLARQGYAVTGHDQRGHGRTAKRNGKLGFIAEQNGFERLVQDARQIVLAGQEKLDKLPFILFGHSMGSYVARRYIQLYSDSVERVVLSGSGGNVKYQGHVARGYAKSMARTFGPQDRNHLLTSVMFGQFNAQFPEADAGFGWLSRDPEVVQSYIADPLCGFIPTNQFFVDLFDGIFIIHNPREVRKVRSGLPIFFVSGSADPVGNLGEGVFMAAKQLADAGAEDVTVFLGEGARHELLNELHRERYYEIIADWMKRDA
ncbi:alpha/beta hydrolase [Planococcus lenghuensis]|uniref:Alpha/beta hydrolase n=1 Tax=Planococcus lenghuensis TaxID=2213202 RepID=A0A1Q2KZR8_9BACL|nr:alpha/beta hydrolase [Planococcus lenghuensis]AQQ53689.1 alpha/beta hydrolase [Planococcus lenghuensis]